MAQCIGFLNANWTFCESFMPMHACIMTKGNKQDFFAWQREKLAIVETDPE